MIDTTSTFDLNSSDAYKFISRMNDVTNGTVSKEYRAAMDEMNSRNNLETDGIEDEIFHIIAAMFHKYEKQLGKNVGNFQFIGSGNEAVASVHSVVAVTILEALAAFNAGISMEEAIAAVPPPPESVSKRTMRKVALIVSSSTIHTKIEAYGVLVSNIMYKYMAKLAESITHET